MIAEVQREDYKAFQNYPEAPRKNKVWQGS